MALVLVIDDNETIRDGIAATIRKMGHIALAAASGASGMELFRKHEVDFVITDLKMDGMDGVEVLRTVRQLNPDVPAMLITAFGAVETAVEAMKLGAFDFLTKPFAPEVVRLKVERALELAAERKARARLARENELLRDEADQRDGLGGGGQFQDLVGSSARMQTIFGLIDRIAQSDSTVLISGESGTGKELVARAIFQRSRRADGPFIRLNCGAMNESLLESELFGHEKGAFTGAIKRKLGRFELADGGTLFLDEIGDVSPALQLKLLRVLQERELERVGGETTVKVDVRVLAATHKDLQKEVAAGRFREDLYYRLHVVPIALPPLRERSDDIPSLVRHFLSKLRVRTNPRVTSIDEAALDMLVGYGWPGNVRELENVVEQAMVFATGSTITPDVLPAFLANLAAEPANGAARGEGLLGRDGLQLPSGASSLPEMLEDLERQLILQAYERAKGVKTETARLLGLKTSALYYKLDKYGIT